MTVKLKGADIFDFMPERKINPEAKVVQERTNPPILYKWNLCIKKKMSQIGTLV